LVWFWITAGHARGPAVIQNQTKQTKT